MKVFMHIISVDTFIFAVLLWTLLGYHSFPAWTWVS